MIYIILYDKREAYIASATSDYDKAVELRAAIIERFKKEKSKLANEVWIEAYDPYLSIKEIMLNTFA